jgi:hypothetical protein
MIVQRALLFVALNIPFAANAALIDFEVDFSALHYSINTNSPAGVISGPGPFPAFDFTGTFHLDSSLLAIDGSYDVSSAYSPAFSANGAVTSTILATVSSGAVTDLSIDYNQTVIVQTFADIGGYNTVVSTTTSHDNFDSNAGIWTSVQSGSYSGLFSNIGGATTTTSGTFAINQLTAVPLPAAAWLFGSALLGLGAMKRKRA